MAAFFHLRTQTMITTDTITHIGKTIKTHGIKGEIAFELNAHIVAEIDYLILQVEGIYVPFFVNQIRHFTDTTGTVKFQNIDTEQQAKRHIHCPIYLHNDFLSHIQPIENHRDELIGYQLIDTQGETIGDIIDINHTTSNPLLIVSTPTQQEKFIPLTEAYIEQIDSTHKKIVMNLPQGLLEL